MHCSECDVEMHRVDSRRGSDCEDHTTFECPECGDRSQRTRWRPL
ncbi:hypothetical protein SAMN04487947_0662 [Halogeometricum rufum]|uniref:Small CPxCG-related zinc finger protein n=1 Tax=Halogeometricum rufum TaxID=553469 RepID=A0A1I6G6V4_9EURY|nr:hypothetical protein SAMN04487947_0662 [Halogeometricum rufum]